MTSDDENMDQPEPAAVPPVQLMTASPDDCVSYARRCLVGFPLSYWCTTSATYWPEGRSSAVYISDDWDYY